MCAKGSTQKFLATHAAVYNVFNLQLLIRRQTLCHLRAVARQTWVAATFAV